MERCCAWCGKRLPPKAGGDGVSHGICEPCALALMAQEVLEGVRKADGAYVRRIYEDCLALYGAQGWRTVLLEARAARARTKARRRGGGQSRR